MVRSSAFGARVRAKLFVRAVVLSAAWGSVAGTAGCADPHVGTGPIEFSPRAQATYDAYRATVGPGAFVINRSGGTFYTYCESTACRGGTVSKALQMCRSAEGGECYVYDIGGQIVWRRDLAAPAKNAGAPVPLMHCLLRGSDVLTTAAACAKEGGTPRDR